MQRVHRMEVGGRRAGGGERGRELPRDEPRLADARDDDPARRVGQEPHRPGEALVEPLRRPRASAAGLELQHPAAQRDQARRRQTARTAGSVK